jgi:uncharacterized protein YeaO (DUF488 family)
MVLTGVIMIGVKRIYEPPAASDGTRFLVDHLWPRGLKRDAVKVKGWIKAVSPSDELRQWYGHEPAKWKEFQRRYFAQLDQQPGTWQPLLEAAQEGDITLFFSARAEEHNNAVALENYLEKRLQATISDRSKAQTSKLAARGRKDPAARADGWPFDASHRGVCPPVAGAPGDLRGGCADHPPFAA